MNIDPRIAQLTDLIAAENLEAAESMCETLAGEKSEDPFFLHARGLIEFKHRKYGNAIKSFQDSIRRLPNNGNCYSNLGEALRRDGKALPALRAFQEALLLEPKLPKAHLGVGNALADLKRFSDAQKRFRFLIELYPDMPEGYHYLGVMLTELNRVTEAISVIRKAIAMRPSYYEARFSLANALGKIDQTDEAIEIYEKLLEENPGDSAIRNNYANLLRMLGRTEEADYHLGEAAKVNGNRISALYNRSAKDLLKAITPEQLEQLEQQLDNVEMPLDDRINLHFTLAKYYHGQEDFDRAFEHFKAGNDVDTRKEPYSASDNEKLTEIFMKFFSKDFFENFKNYGCESELPVLIFGMPRSGTSLVEQILSSHPKVFGGGELKYLTQRVQALGQQFKGVGYPALLKKVDRVQGCLMGEDYVAKLRALIRDSSERAAAERITDKMPGNFLHLGLVALMLPKAKLIHCRRDPMDSLLSCYSQRFTEVISYSRKLEDLGHYYQQYEKLMAYWHLNLPAPILDVQYEEVIEDPETMSRKIIDFVGLEWDDACLNFHQTERIVKTASLDQVRQPIYNTSVGKWRRYEKHLDPLIEALGPYGPAAEKA